ncbi:MAG: RagB/SusD family nutrient uptake outer membrane protein [Niabella sp.]
MMKIYITILSIAVLSLTGCKKFLEIQPKDLKIAKTVDDYQELLNGEGWGKSMGSGSDAELYWLEMLTDDVGEYLATSSSPSDSKIQYSQFYTWSNDPDLTYINKAVSAYNIGTWTWLYRVVNISNMVISEIDNMTTQNENSRALLKSEALFSRALAFFYILNIWGEPYKPTATALGVPLKTTPFPSLLGTPRSTVQEGYDLIINDLLEAETTITASGVVPTGSVFHVSKEAIEILLSRAYLYTQNWQKAKEYADKAIATGPALFDLNSETFSTSAATNFFNPRNTEILFTYHRNAKSTTGSTYIFGQSVTASIYVVSNDMINVFAKDLVTSAVDIRKNAFVQVLIGRNFSKTPLQEGSAFLTPTTKLYDYDIRIGEAYINRAEASAQLNNLAEAVADLNTLRAKRISGSSAVTYSNQAALLNFIYEERRRELFFQGHRWFDLRRTTQPAITHVYTPVVGTGTTATIGTPLTFVLSQNDAGYTIEIPVKEREYNTSVTPLGLPERVPQ